VENEDIFPDILLVNVVDRFKLFNRDGMISYRQSKASTRHSVCELHSGNVNVCPPTAVVSVIASEGEAFITQPQVERRIASFQRLVTDEEGLGSSASDPQSFFFHCCFSFPLFHKEKAHHQMGLKKCIRPIVQALAPCRKAVGCRAVNELVSRALFMVTASYHKQRKKTSNCRRKHCFAVEFIS